MKFEIVTVVALVFCLSQCTAFGICLQDQSQRDANENVDAQSEQEKDEAPAAQENPAFVDIARDLELARVAGAIEAAMRKELNRMKVEFELSDELMKEIHKSLDKEMEKAAERCLGSISRSTELDDELLKQLWDAIEPRIDGEQKVLLDQIRDKSNRLRRTIEVRAQAALVGFFDSTVSLTGDQSESLGKLMQENWSQDLNEASFHVALNGGVTANKVFEKIGYERIKEILNADQVNVIDDINSGSINLRRATEAGEAANVEQLKALSHRLMDLRIAEIAETCGLEDRQKMQLSVAAKGAVSKYLLMWSEAVNRVRDNNPAMGIDVELMEMERDPIVFQCTNQKIWRNAIKRVLSDKQSEIYRKKLAARDAVTKSTVVTYMTITVVRDMGGEAITLDDYLNVTSMLDDKIDLESGRMFDAVIQCFKIPDEDFERVMPTSVWDDARPAIERRRQMFGINEDAAREDAGADGDDG